MIWDKDYYALSYWMDIRVDGASCAGAGDGRVCGVLEDFILRKVDWSGRGGSCG